MVNLFDGGGGQELGAARCALLVLALQIQDFDLLERGVPLEVGAWFVQDDDGHVGGGGGRKRFLFF